MSLSLGAIAGQIACVDSLWFAIQSNILTNVPGQWIFKVMLKWGYLLLYMVQMKTCVFRWKWILAFFLHTDVSIESKMVERSGFSRCPSQKKVHDTQPASRVNQVCGLLLVYFFSVGFYVVQDRIKFKKRKEHMSSLKIHLCLCRAVSTNSNRTGQNIH